MSEVIQLREADGDSNPVCSDSSQLGTEHSLLFLFLIYETFLFFLFFFYLQISILCLEKASDTSCFPKIFTQNSFKIIE